MASIKTTSSHRILINGSMKEISLDPETILDIEATSGCDIQIVNLGCGDDAAGAAATSSLLMEVLQQKVSSSSSSPKSNKEEKVWTSLSVEFFFRYHEPFRRIFCEFRSQ